MKNKNYLFLLIILLIPELILADTVINAFRFDYQRYPSLCKLSNGDMAATWSCISSVRDYNGPMKCILRPDLSRNNDFDMPVSAERLLGKDNALLSPLNNGYFVAFYRRFTSTDSLDLDLYLRKFNNAGQSIGNEIRVSFDSLGFEFPQALEYNASDNILVASWSKRTGENSCAYYYKNYDNNLNSLSDNIVIFGTGNMYIGKCDIAFISSEKLMSVWEEQQPSYERNIVGRMMNVDGSDQTDIFMINTHSDGDFITPDILGLIDGGALVSWTGDFQPYEAAIWGKIYDEYGLPLDPEEFLLSYPDTNGDGHGDIQTQVQASQDQLSGNIAVSWCQNLTGSPGWGTSMIRFFNSSMEPLSEPIRAGETEGQLTSPVSVFINSDTALVCWSGVASSEYYEDIVGAKVGIPETSIGSSDDIIKAEIFLSYPNPFNSVTTITLTGAEQADIGIYDIMGRLITTLHTVSGRALWDASGYSSGLYFARVLEEKAGTIKLILVK